MFEEMSKPVGLRVQKVQATTLMYLLVNNIWCLRDGLLNEKLMRACRSGSLEDTRALLNAGANPNALIFGTTPLHEAIRAREEEFIQLLIETSFFVFPWESTCWGKASYSANYVRPHGLDAYGDTPLHTAAKSGRHDAMRLLLEKDCSSQFIEHKNDKGDTAMDIAVKANKSECVSLLISYKAGHRRQCSSGFTATEMADTSNDGRIARVASYGHALNVQVAVD